MTQLLDPKLICEFSYHVHLPSCVVSLKKISTKQERAVVQAMRHLVADLWSTQAIVVTRSPLEFSVVLVVGVLAFYAATVVTRAPSRVFRWSLSSFCSSLYFCLRRPSWSHVAPSSFPSFCSSVYWFPTQRGRRSSSPCTCGHPLRQPV